MCREDHANSLITLQYVVISLKRFKGMVILIISRYPSSCLALYLHIFPSKYISE